jgi:hypothetical protein
MTVVSLTSNLPTGAFSQRPSPLQQQMPEISPLPHGHLSPRNSLVQRIGSDFIFTARDVNQETQMLYIQAGFWRGL